MSFAFQRNGREPPGDAARENRQLILRGDCVAVAIQSTGLSALSQRAEPRFGPIGFRYLFLSTPIRFFRSRQVVSVQRRVKEAESVSVVQQSCDSWIGPILGALATKQ